MDKFRLRYRERCDVLLMDDVQILGRGEGVQEEFFHTLNDFFDNHMNKTGADIYSANLSHDIKTTFYPGIFTGHNASVETSKGEQQNSGNEEKKNKNKKDKDR